MLRNIAKLNRSACSAYTYLEMLEWIFFFSPSGFVRRYSVFETLPKTV